MIVNTIFFYTPVKGLIKGLENISLKRWLFITSNTLVKPMTLRKRVLNGEEKSYDFF